MSLSATVGQFPAPISNCSAVLHAATVLLLAVGGASLVRERERGSLQSRRGADQFSKEFLFTSL